MANIDVSDVLADPDFIDPVQVITRVPTVNGFGETTLTQETVDTVGSVQPASGRTIARLPEALRVANLSSFWVKAPKIIASSTGKYPSILVFAGQRYQVQVVFDWSNWGQGWTEGTCVAEIPA